MEFDYVIVGAGTAGCLMANRLSADRNVTVLLLEAGRRDDYVWVHIPVGYLKCIGNPRTDWMFKTEPDAGLNGRSLRYPRGKVLGGCSSINGMIYMRGQKRDYDHWGALGNDGWSWDECLPAFMRHEDYHRGADAVHGSGGEWRVDRQRLNWEILDAFRDAAVQAGIPAQDDFNRGNNEGVGYFEVNQKDGWRWNAAKAFLKVCYGRLESFEMWTKAQVRRIVTEKADDGGVRAVGVEVVSEAGELEMVRARREVILCAGAIGSPQLLQQSGIGPGALLQEHGISVVHDLPGVGANLQDHLQIRAVYQVDGVQTLNTMANHWLGKAKIAWEYLAHRTGPMSMAPSQLGAFTKSDPSLSYPNLEYHVQPLSLDAFGEPLHAFNAITASVCNLNPTSRGRVEISSGDWQAAPKIMPNYLSTTEDQVIAAQSLRLTRSIMAQPALAAYRPVEYKPGSQYQTDDELVQLAGDIATTIFHPVGTCKMGPDHDEMAVVDARLRLRGVAGLRVVDGSVMPTITSGNTNSPILMIAERAAAWVRADAGRGV